MEKFESTTQDENPPSPEKQTVRTEQRNFAQEAKERLEEKGVKMNVPEIRDRDEHLVFEKPSHLEPKGAQERFSDEQIEHSHRSAGINFKKQQRVVYATLAAAMISTHAGQAVDKAEAGARWTESQQNEYRQEVKEDYATKARERLPDFILPGEEIPGEDTSPEDSEALWDKLITQEKQKPFSFITSDEWKSLNSETKAELMERIVDSDLDQVKSTYKAAPFYLFEQFAHEPKAQVILAKAANESPKYAFRRYSMYKNFPWSEEVIKSALVAGDPDITRQELWTLVLEGQLDSSKAVELEKIIDQHQEQPNIENIIKSYEDLNSEEQLSFFFADGEWQIQNTQTKGDILLKLLENNDERAAGMSFLFFPMIAHHDDIETIMNQSVAINPTEAIKSVAVYFDPNYQLTRSVLEKAILIDGKTAMENLDKWQALLPNSDQIIETVIKHNPELSITYFEHIKDFEWAEPFLKETLKTHIGDAIEHFDSYKEHVPWAEEVLKEAVDVAADEAPKFLMQNFSRIKNFDWSEGAVKKALDNDPVLAFDFFIQYKHFPWAGTDFLVEKAALSDAKSVLLFLTDEGLNFSKEDQARIRENISELAHAADKLLARNREASYTRFKEDVAVQRTGDINPDWIPDKHIIKANAWDVAQYRTLIARSLYFQGIEDVTEQVVRNESQRIFNARNEHADIPIFEGRHVIVAAHGELTPLNFRNKQDPNRFGKDYLLKEIERQQSPNAQKGQNIQLILERPQSNTREEVEVVKNNTLEAIRNLPSPMTFIFDGHGGPNGLYFSEGLADQSGEVDASQPWNRIDPEELAQALIERYENADTDTPTIERDVLIFSNCYSSTFLRKVYAILESVGVQKPITVGMSEYGQLGYSDWGSLTGNDFMDNTILNLDGGGGKATLKNVMEHDLEQNDSNPSLYIPDDKNRTMQLSENEALKNVVEQAS